MSITTTLNGLSIALMNVVNPNYPTSGGQYLVTKSRPTEFINQEDFPLVMLCYDWQKDQEFELHQGGGGHHKYHIAIFLFVGAMNTDLAELHSRIEPWPLLIAPPILTWAQGIPDSISVQVGPPFLPYRVGFFPEWGGPKSACCGLKADLYIIEEL